MFRLVHDSRGEKHPLCPWCTEPIIQRTWIRGGQKTRLVNGQLVHRSCYDKNHNQGKWYTARQHAIDTLRPLAHMPGLTDSERIEIENVVFRLFPEHVSNATAFHAIDELELRCKKASVSSVVGMRAIHQARSILQKIFSVPS